MNATAPQDISRAYALYLRQRWPSRLRALAIVASTVAAFWGLLSWLLAQQEGRPFGWAELAAHLRLVLIPPAILVLSRFVRHSPMLPWLMSAACCFAYSGVSYLTLYELGLQRSELFLAWLMLSFMAQCSILPMERRLRQLTYFAYGLVYLTLDFSWPDPRPFSQRALVNVAIVLTAVAVAFMLEMFFRSHRRNFALREQMAQALEALRAGRQQAQQAAVSLVSSASELSESTLALSSRAKATDEESRAMAGAAEQMAQSAQALLQRSRTASSTMATADEHSRRLDQMVGDIEQQMHSLSEAVALSERSFSELSTHSARIELFVETAQKIAAQTHMVAVNAGIEAVRSGAAGKGFAVIAQEVRKLAAHAGQGGREVESVVEALRTQMQTTLGTITQVREQLQRFQAVFQEARATLVGIRGVVGLMQQSIGENARDATEQARSTEDIAASTARLLELVQAQNRMSAEVAQTTTNLSRLAATLHALLPDESAVQHKRSRGQRTPQGAPGAS